MESELLHLLEQLEEIGHWDRSLFNSPVRQSIGDAVFEGVVLMTTGYVAPASFGLATPEGDKHVHTVISRYVDTARRLVVQQGLARFHQRLAAVQNRAVKTDEGRDFEDYLGNTNPDCFDNDGRVIRTI